MQVIRAQAMGFCFGVRDALAIVETIPDPAAVTIHGELVHNESVLIQLESAGFRVAAEDQRGRLDDRPAVLITAHGVSDLERSRLLAAGKQLVDGTCPLVRRAHGAARQLAAEGRHVLVIGRPGHVEVQGIVEDLPSFDVVPDVSAVHCYARERLGVVCQTTTAPRLAAAILAAVRDQNPLADIRFVDTVCQPTRDRQSAVENLLERVEAMVVVGGRRSNNTRELVALCRERGKPVHHVQSAAEIQPGWFAGQQTIGLTAGTSTPDAVIEAVFQRLCQLGKESSP
ncbi:MAG TPA: 4-hydroxy-3-methylbut-2-enyl diphosphate reductase [Pirellulales bacterium]|nr:4-hydroxy-3-methylbut-2-enyl diphosphate reductase [Pirellulales bacterium]